ncbi:MAG: MerR family transcriptional regulator [Nocardioidaceae bacterium]|nr:MerR family transcriptional regulator [Nocardioidaceae bacterium]MCL2612591.1 MerR family transcriptional regulator [Nocardioidaceae bacterium]
MTDTTLLSLTELTERTGLSVRTIRFYRSRGLIPPPIRRGRAGYYDAGHVARLELVQELQQHGFTLGAIEKYVAQLPEDASPDEIALARTMVAPWEEDVPVEMTKEQLDARSGRELSNEDIATLHALGLVRRRRSSYLVNGSQLSSGLRLLELGFPREVALASAAVYQEHGEQMAKELWDVINDQLAPLYDDAEPAHLREIMLRLRPLSIGGLVSAYESALTRGARTFRRRG